jgi:hypothetical protein
MKVALVALACLGLGFGLGGCVIYLNPLCTDQIHNGDETGVDCGGGCGKCDFGQGCRVNDDCDGNNCVASVCKPPPCENGMLDPGETDVDCGGTCRKCSGGRHCQVDGDCFGTCVPGTKVCSSIALSFADEVRSSSGFKAYAIFAGDLDGDGDTDLAIANEYGSSIAIFINNYDHGGAFTHLLNPAGAPDDTVFGMNFPTGAYPTGGAIADFNGDGHFDVITANYHGNSVSVLFNNGTGALNLMPRVTYPTLPCTDPSQLQGCPETSNLAVGDLNGDGALDVIATNPQKSSVSEFLGNTNGMGKGNGTLAAAIDIPVGITGGAMPYSAAIGDFNGDGKQDVAIAEETSGTIIVRLGNGDGTFQTEVPYGIGGVRDYILIVHDMNADGNLDLVCANRGSDNVSVLLGRGDGTFRKAIVTQVSPADAPKTKMFSPYAVTVADFNVDGVPDVATPNYQADSISVLIGIGDGHFEPAREIAFKPDGIHPDTTPYGIAAGDFNKDGKPDLATCNIGSNDLAVKLNNGN